MFFGETSVLAEDLRFALDTGGRLSPGLYWVRLKHAGLEKTTRAVVMQ